MKRLVMLRLQTQSRSEVGLFLTIREKQQAHSNQPSTQNADRQQAGMSLVRAQ